MMSEDKAIAKAIASAAAAALCGPKARRVQSYDMEKKLGVRRANGASKLKDLKPIHKQIIAMHLHGYSVIDIAGEVGQSENNIYHVLSDPLARALIETFSKRMDVELAAMEPLTIAAMRDALETSDIKDRLKAVDIFNKMTGRYVKEDGPSGGFGGHTAESLVSEALRVASEAIRTGNNPRNSIIKAEKDITDVEDTSRSTDIVPAA